MELPSLPAGLARVVEQAVADLAERTGVAPAAITVVAAEARTWPDAGLGCPQPGMRYAQVPQDGALVRLEADGRQFAYHSGGKRRVPFLCERSSSPRPRR